MVCPTESDLWGLPNRTDLWGLYYIVSISPITHFYLIVSLCARMVGLYVRIVSVFARMMSLFAKRVCIFYRTDCGCNIYRYKPKKKNCSKSNIKFT